MEGRREEERKDRVKMKMDSPAVYTKPGTKGGEYKHSPCWRNGETAGPAGSHRGNTYKSLFVCVFLVPNIFQRERGGGLNVSH